MSTPLPAQLCLAPRQRPEKAGKFLVRLWQAGLVSFTEDEKSAGMAQ